MKRILVLVGSSGSGKTTVANELEKRGFHRLVTMTTRPMRDGEINHLHYHFVSEDEFWKIDRVEENKYIEHWYGLSKDEVNQKLKKYDNLVIVMDKNGASAMKKEFRDMVKVIFLTISPEEMERRLRERGESEETIQKRLRQAYDQNEFKKPDVADILINNIDLDNTIQQILAFAKKEAS